MSSQAACGSRIAPLACCAVRTVRMGSRPPATTPAMTSLCPLKYFDALWTTRSAPSASGN